jgi:hypothetical protein
MSKTGSRKEPIEPLLQLYGQAPMGLVKKVLLTYRQPWAKTVRVISLSSAATHTDLAVNADAWYPNFSEEVR